MFCAVCGTKGTGDSVYCTNCGAPLKNDSYEEVHRPTDTEKATVATIKNRSAKAPNHTLGLISMVLGISSWAFYYLLGAITCGVLSLLSPFVAVAGVIISIIALFKSRSPDIKKGFAITGLITSSIFVVHSFIASALAYVCLLLLLASYFS